MSFLERIFKDGPRHHGNQNLPGLSSKRQEAYQSSFEQELFRDGVLYFNHDSFTAEASDRYEDSREWYEQNPYWDERRTEESLADDLLELQHEYAWRLHFSGRVPRNWDIWYNAMNAFEEAGRRGVRLSETLVDAGVSYDHHLVANATGKSQRLNVRQMAFIFARDLPEWNRNQILEAQRQKGVSESEIRQARTMAEDFRRNYRRGRSEDKFFGILSLPSPDNS